MNNYSGVPEEEKGRGCGLAIIVVFLSPLIIIPTLFFFNFIDGGLEAKLRGLNWQDTQGVIVSSSVVNTGKTVWIRRRGNHSSDEVRLYSGDFSVLYSYKGQQFTKNEHRDLKGDDVAADFSYDFSSGTNIDLKVNQKDPSEVIIKPNYNVIICLIIFYVIFNAFVLFSTLRFLVRIFSKESLKSLNRAVHQIPRDFLADTLWTSIGEPLNMVQCGNVGAMSYQAKGGIVCRNYKIEKSSSVCKISTLSFNYIPFWATAILIGGFSNSFLSKNNPELGMHIFSIVFCLFSFCIFYFATYKSHPDIFFDKLIGYFWIGRPVKNKEALADLQNRKVTQLSDITAIQLLFADENEKGNNYTERTHYEVNLILESKRRVNVLNTNALNSGFKYAAEIALFLMLPLYIDPRLGKH